MGNSTHAGSRVEVATAGIRDEAKTWFRLSVSMEAAWQRLRNLQVRGFSVADLSRSLPFHEGNQLCSDALNEYTGLIDRAHYEFAALSDALNKCADVYEETDGKSAQSFDDIAKQ